VDVVSVSKQDASGGAAPSASVDSPFQQTAVPAPAQGETDKFPKGQGRTLQKSLHERLLCCHAAGVVRNSSVLAEFRLPPPAREPRQHASGVSFHGRKRSSRSLPAPGFPFHWISRLLFAKSDTGPSISPGFLSAAARPEFSAGVRTAYFYSLSVGDFPESGLYLREMGQNQSRPAPPVKLSATGHP